MTSAAFSTSKALPWLAPGQDFPDPALSWGPDDPIAGLLAAGGALDVLSLLAAYRKGIFPWFSQGQPILWWSPDPRMVLETQRFTLHRSLRRRLQQFRADTHCQIRFDNAFNTVIHTCAQTPRTGQSGTWIVPDMVEAYTALHHAGFAHSVETWIDGQLAGGLYCTAIGHAVFGESMFTRQTDASKIALAALAAFCRAQGIERIDCQQNTAHLASLGATEMARADFIEGLDHACARPAPIWSFEPLYWNELLLGSAVQTEEAP
ncbi:MAG: leucyl/phenylalanyl-tRNA--protein transferase [Burkholderiaceae bacterium]|jgi:leucyl/phenylalanyl-tRNA--protein transferase|nr:leucyl/phenylalanyl-tRNA--protein transferase [Burkholderiaceae bacterium]